MSTDEASPWAHDTVPQGRDEFDRDEPADPGRERPLEIRFTGSGSEYFRIWIVNLLLSIVTLSLYRPWAKVRRLRYFYGNTLVGGHALDFHGDPRRMLRGYLLVGAMVIAYSVAGRFSPASALVAFVLVSALAPALMRAAMQFRLANTSWRGLRFRFSGDMAGAYRAVLPLCVPGLVLVALNVTGMQDPQHPAAWYLKGVGMVFAAAALLAPWAWWMLKRYQHDHYGIGHWTTRLAIGPGPFYLTALKVVGIFFASMLGVTIVVGVIAVAFRTSLAAGFAHPEGSPLMAMLMLVVSVSVWLLMLLLPAPYATSRLQNLVWSNTSADALRFDSELRFGALLGLTLKNWLLMLLTLGLYWPFASVALYRMRVQSVTPRLSADLDRLHARMQLAASDASGDAAGDLFGFDIGF